MKRSISITLLAAVSILLAGCTKCNCPQCPAQTHTTVLSPAPPTVVEPDTSY